MPIPNNKADLIEAIQNNYRKLELDLQSIPEELTRNKELEGHAKGTKMSICDLVAYLVGWGQLVLKWHQSETEHKTINFPETGYQWNELGLLAQKFYRDYKELDYGELQENLKQTVQQILTVIDQTDEETLYQKPFYKHYPLGRMIQLNTSSPYKNARGRVRKWMRAG